MHNIGNFHDAQTILMWVRSHPEKYGRPECVRGGVAPEGWEYVSSGSFRSVWLSPEGVTYKVTHSGGGYVTRQQEGEIDNLKEAWSKGTPDGCRLPRFDRFDVEEEVVVAMEMIHGPLLGDYEGDDRDDLYDRLRDCEVRFRLSDLHDENALVDEDGLLVPVDFGM